MKRNKKSREYVMEPLEDRTLLSGTVLLTDQFTNDTHLNSSLWQLNGPVASVVGEDLTGNPNIAPQITFSNSAGMDVLMVVDKGPGPANVGEADMIQSVHSFNLPFTAQAEVSGSVSHGGTFVFVVANATDTDDVEIFGDLNPANGQFYSMYWIDKTGTRHTLISNPSVNVEYDLSITVDGSGNTTLNVVSGGQTLATTTADNLGSGPFYVLMGQFEGDPHTAGNNDAQWQNVTVTTPQLVFTHQPSNAVAGTTINPAVVVDIEDPNGNIITTDDSAVTLSAPGLGGTVTVNAVSGVATFGALTPTVAGTYSLSASDSMDGLSGFASDTITVTAAAAEQLAFVVQPSNAIAGNSISPAITVDVEDQFGNLVTTDNSTVTLSEASGPFSLLWAISQQASNGVATFNGLTFITAGTYTLQAVDGSLNSATSDSFTISAAAPAQITFTGQPSNVVAGAAISPAITVQVFDQFDNPVGDSLVTLSVASGPAASLFGSFSQTTDINGIATLADVVLHMAGTYTLLATDGSVSTNPSTPFAVSPAAAASVAFIQQPTNVTAGLAISPAITVNLVDQFGNPISAAGSSVTLSVQSGPSNAVSGTLTEMTTTGGIATFDDISLDKSGTYTLAATAGSAVADSANFTVNPAAAVGVTFIQQPGNTTAGLTFNPAVTVEVVDQFGNGVGGGSVTINLASGPTTTLLGTLTETAAANGIATFANLAVDIVGTYTLAATDGSLTAATSNGFTISAAGASKLVFVQQPENALAGAEIAPAITVDVEDLFGNLAATDNSKITASLASGPSAALGGTVAVHAVGGVATFGDLSLTVAGSYTLMLSDKDFSPSITSNTFTISAAAASKIKFTAQPTNAVAGSNIGPAISLKAKDAFGNPVDGDTLTLSIATGPTGATIGGTDTAVTASNGVATFSNVLLTIAGGYTLSAGDGSINSAPSGTITITPAKASQMIFKNVPANVVAGVIIAPAIIVKIQDQFGNLCNTNDSTVTLGISNGPAKAKVLTGATVAAVNGVADFTDVSLNKAGACELSAADGKLTPGVSSAITVVHGAAAKFAFEQALPPNATAGAAISPGIAVDVDDAYGNLCSNKSTTITLEILTGPAGTTPGQVVGGTPSVAAIAGTAMFNDAVLTKSGDYTLQAVNGSLNFGASTSITVSAAAAAKLSFKQQPTNVGKNKQIVPPVVVKIKDAFGNLVTTDSQQITIAVASGPGGVLSGTTTVAAVGGLATFSGLSLNVKGVYTLVATGSDLTAATSAEFTVG